MGGTYTTKKYLYKPDVNSTGWGTLFNLMIDILDRVFDLAGYRRVGATPDRWYPAGMRNCAALTTVAPTANVLRAYPHIVPYKTTLDKIAINCTTLTAGKQRLGIYSDDGNCAPGARLLDAGEVDTGTTGVKAIDIAQVIEAGTLLWIVVVGNAAPTLRATPANAGSPILGYDNTLGTDAAIGWSVALTYAALPATFPNGAAVITAAAAQPAVFLRASE